MANTIITIGRQFGSGGHEIGSLLAKKMNISFYDKEMLKEAAKESGICEELFVTHDEKPTNSFLYSLVMDTYSYGHSGTNIYADMPLNHRLFLAQFDALKRIASRESCVLVGRCADYALEEFEHCTRIFIHADMDHRVRRIAKLMDLTDVKAKDLIQKQDKRRSSYYNYFTNKKWGAAESYDLTINSGVLGIEKTVDFLYQWVQAQQ